MRVIGTAGHVDHGKSTLIAALTGIHPDRLKEEQERQMTIDLGFAWLTLPEGEDIGIVDVPGHRDFIENMLSGIGGIDAALLVIAADEGVMPQTREHLAILDLLQIPAGIVVLTKIDLIDDPAWLDLVEADVRQVLAGTILQEAPVCRVSSRTQDGFPDLLRTLSLLLQDQPARPDLGRPRLPVDRVFSIAGFGTVVTGTLSDGHLSVGDEVEILPSGQKGRIRGLQTHKKKEDSAVPGSRTAVNMSGVDVDEVRRGEVVIHPGEYRSSRRLDVRFRLLPGASNPLRHDTEVKLFVGAAETVANVRLLGTEALQPGAEGWLQLELRNPVVAVRGDRYILRRPSPGETLGGGAIVDPYPRRRHKRFDQAVIAGLEATARGTPKEVLLQASLGLGPTTRQELVERSRLDSTTAETTIQEVLSAGQLISLDDLLVAASQWSALRENVTTLLSAYHHNNPLRRGIPREELKSRLKVQPRLFNALLSKMAAEKIVNENKTLVALPEHVIAFTPQQQAAIRGLLAKFAAAPYGPPSIKECQAEVGEEVFAALVDLDELVSVSTEIVFRKADYEVMVDKIRSVLLADGQITLAKVRDLLNTSRKYVQALLEHLDTTGLTVRDGDSRKLREHGSPNR
ncbi:MAG: selenocysteine-specific translation elongation factor [Anaerolineales bacterium]|nr:selenocysteine-specific translation elongation factor [Anaerolineales bacterium]